MEKEDAIIDDIQNNISVVIVGPSNSGKTYWVQNILIPKLKKLGKSVQYSKDGFSKTNSADIAIFDEAETLSDLTQLQRNHPEERPYYSEKYLKDVADWYNEYSNHVEPSVYVISRKEKDMQFLLDNFNKSDWDNRDLKVYRFPLI